MVAISGDQIQLLTNALIKIAESLHEIAAAIGALGTLALFFLLFKKMG